ncbi:MAG: zf-HC2 domain-containing protein [Defluviimonas sp.]|nr:zf-HC2 domain-containing protein [Defluviimonas sp.]
MLSCKEVAERASALIDGELGMFDLLQMRLHLAMCKGCSAFVRQMRITRDLTASAALLDDQRADEVDRRIAAILSRLPDGRHTGP